MKKLSIIGIMLLSVLGACSEGSNMGEPNFAHKELFISLVKGSWDPHLISGISGFQTWFNSHTSLSPEMRQLVDIDNEGDFTIQGATAGESMTFTFRGVNEITVNGMKDFNMAYYQLSGDGVISEKSWVGISFMSDFKTILIGQNSFGNKAFSHADAFPKGQGIKFLTKNSTRIHNQQIKTEMIKSILTSQ